MNAAQRFNRFMNGVYDRLRHEQAYDVAPTWSDGRDAGFSSLDGHTYAVLLTFRRNGQPVPSPVWFALDADRVVVRTFADSGKIKRIGRDPRVLIFPSSLRGRPKGPAIKATARILPHEAWADAEARLVASYGLGRRLYEGLLGEPDEAVAYLELRPGDDRHGRGTDGV